MIPLPIKTEDLPYGYKLQVGMGESMILATLDFETYSEAGFIWDSVSNKFTAPPNAMTKGLPSIGAAVYSEHPSTEVLSCAYDLRDGHGIKLWIPTNAPPDDLFLHLSQGRLLESWNIAFEYWIWMNVCVRKYGWPPLPILQLRCAAAKSRAFSLPGSLDPAGKVLNIQNKKNEDGKRLLNKFSMPRNPTKSDLRIRIKLEDDIEEAQLLYQYNIQDIRAESELSSLTPDLGSFELEFWQCDQIINRRGVQIDLEIIHKAITILEQAYFKYNAKIKLITGGKVKSASEVAKIRDWMMSYGVHAPTLDSEDILALLVMDSLPEDVRKVLQIRKMIGSASVKKLYAMLNQCMKSGRIHDLFIYHSARTGRAAGSGPQPQNLPNGGPTVVECPTCTKYYGIDGVGNLCPWCGVMSANKTEWNPKAVINALETIATGNLDCVEYFWGNAIEIISGSLRGLFISAPRKDLICSDYSAIEAVVLAALAGEEWRLEVFRTHGMIYEMSASKVCGIPFEDFVKYKKENKSHHPKRKIGKISELSSGYQGWLGAWKQFGADEFFNDEDIKKSILAWRKASPGIVEIWGGQQRNWNPCLYGLEGAAVQAVMSPGREFKYRSISYIVKQDILYCKLLSGRYLVYHKPQLTQSTRRPDTLTLSFEGWNTNPKNGSIGWIRMETYGGKLTENIVQATARDILANAIVNLEKHNYPVVLHVHDEIVSEIPEGFGSLEEFEQIMSQMPIWASDWPIKAQGGWRAKRYGK